MLLRRGNCEGKPLFFAVFRGVLNSIQYRRIQLNPVGLATLYYTEWASFQTRYDQATLLYTEASQRLPVRLVLSSFWTDRTLSHVIHLTMGVWPLTVPAKRAPGL